jgi:hypothetical protein
MTAPRNLEDELAELLRRIETALAPEVKAALHGGSHLPQEPEVALPKNEVGTEYADER